MAINNTDVLGNIGRYNKEKELTFKQPFRKACLKGSALIKALREC